MLHRARRHVARAGAPVGGTPAGALITPESLAPLFSRSHGLLLTAGSQAATLRHATWNAASLACETVFLVGPLKDKPVLQGPARVWLLECELPAQSGAVREVLRHDAHAIALVGPLQADTAELVVHAALSGSLVIAELTASDVVGALEQLADRLTDRLPLASALLGVAIAGPTSTELHRLTDEARALLVSRAPLQEVIARCERLTGDRRSVKDPRQKHAPRDG